MTKLHLGCGRTALPGYLNVDLPGNPLADAHIDLDAPGLLLPCANDSVTDILMIHVLEHITNTLPLMQDLHRVAVPGCKLEVRVPHGASDDAYEDPTHVRNYFPQSFCYFGQPFYWRADYGYRGDWDIEIIELRIAEKYKHLDDKAAFEASNTLRNVISEIRVVMTAVKPIRNPDRSLQKHPKIVMTRY